MGIGRRVRGGQQEREAQRRIRDHVPGQLKMNYALWTRQAVGELIARCFGVHLAVRAVGEYLKRWGFTPLSLSTEDWFFVTFDDTSEGRGIAASRC